MANFDRDWLNENGEAWGQRYDYVRNAENHLEKCSRLEATELSDKELWDYAYWTNEFRSGEDALPLFRRYQERHPQDPDPAYFIGVQLIIQGDDAGLESLRLAGTNPNLIEQSAHLGYDYLKQQGKEEEAQAWWEEPLKQNEDHIAAQEERDSVDSNDQLAVAEIGTELVDELLVQLKNHKHVGKVWLARKVVKYAPESPVYIVAFAPKGLVFDPERLQMKVAESLDLGVSIFVVCVRGGGKALAKKVIAAGKRIQ